jgi:hypothetical protein
MAFDNPKYKSLSEVLEMAYIRASEGKGHQHHSHGEPFEEQWIVRGAKVFGLGGPLFQATKKMEQVMKMEKEGYPAKDIINELLDVINYSAGAIISIKNGAELG